MWDSISRRHESQASFVKLTMKTVFRTHENCPTKSAGLIPKWLRLNIWSCDGIHLNRFLQLILGTSESRLEFLQTHPVLEVDFRKQISTNTVRRSIPTSVGRKLLRWKGETGNQRINLYNRVWDKNRNEIGTPENWPIRSNSDVCQSNRLDQKKCIFFQLWTLWKERLCSLSGKDLSMEC
jgi:hypothetical protein